METTHNKIALTSSELSNIWTSYMNDTMATCGIKYFLAKVEDEQIREILQFALELSQNNVNKITQIMKEENFPVPQGFNDHDVNIQAPRLFSDTFFLDYMENMARFGLTSYSLALSMSARADIVQYYSECLSLTNKLHNDAIKLSQEKGIFLRPPLIPVPNQVEFVHMQSFLGTWFGKQRPLLAIEIANLYYNLRRNIVGKALIMGFSQVARSKEVRQLMERGRDIAAKHMEVFGSILNEEHIPAPMIWDSAVTDSTVSPFSDKLMMYHITALIASGVGQYGIAMSVSPRSDLAIMYARLSAEIGHYANDAANIMIDNGWMEKPPQTVDREALAKV